ncbi:Zn-ribbon domain-containing OB-fold protein [Halomicrococcus gelatinilyticus]|uniref:Zn-ribbon domain-containing OB-fold protein n=1 Tax=Halomicrococcus gelatinilyticus TaxID=1702103 RepID=UPI002E0D5C1A
MTDADYHDEGYDDWLDAVEDGDGFYLECENGHGSLPPRRVCPDCGATDLAEAPLPDAGEVATFTEIAVAPPSFEDETPYVTAVVDFGPVRLTGQVRDADGAELVGDDVAVGMTVAPAVGETQTTGERVLVFEPR